MSTTVPGEIHDHLPSPQSEHHITRDMMPSRHESPKGSSPLGPLAVRKPDASTHDTIMEDFGSRHDKGGHEILSPRAIPPHLAQYSDRTTTLRQQRSVADRLGTLVERGWATCDDMDEKHERFLNLRSMTQAVPDQEPVSDERHSTSLCGGSLSFNAQEVVPRVGTLLHTDNAAASAFVGSDADSSRSRSKTDDLGRADTRRKRTSDTSSYSDRNADEHARIGTPSSSQDDNCDGQPSLADVPQEPFSALPRSDCQDKIILDSNIQPPSTASVRAPDGRSSSSSSHAARTASPRKSSILTNILTGKWLRAGTVDKQPASQVLSRKRRTSILTGSSNTLTRCGIDMLDEKVGADDSLASEREKQDREIVMERGHTGIGFPASPESTLLPETSTEATPIPQHFTPPLGTFKAADDVDVPAHTLHVPSEMAAEPLGRFKASPHPPQLAVNKASETSLGELGHSSNATQARRLHTTTHEDDCLSRKGIKKVQVVVSFDGLDELVVEARVQDRKEQ